MNCVVAAVGCINDVRLNNAWLPMDRSQNDESEAAVFSVRSQNIQDGCESSACVGILCEPGLICVDVWRQADCRLLLMNVHIGIHTCTCTQPFNGYFPRLQRSARLPLKVRMGLLQA